MATFSGGPFVVGGSEEEAKVIGTVKKMPPTVLRVKRPLDESPSKVLVMSYKRFKASGGVEEDHSEQEEEVNRVFHLAGTVETTEGEGDSNGQSIERVIQSALSAVREWRSSGKGDAIRKSVKVKDQVGFPLAKAKEAMKTKSDDNRFKVVSQKRGLGSSGLNAEDGEHSEVDNGPFYHLLDLVAEEDIPNKRCKSDTDRSDEGKVTLNGIPMDCQKAPVHVSDACDSSGFVFDLYLPKGGTVEWRGEEDNVHNQFVSIRHADEDYEFDFHQEGNDNERFMEDDDDSNDEDNWRNDYPDSDPDKEETGAYGYDYDQGDGEEGIVNSLSRVRIDADGNELSSDEFDDYIHSRDFDGLDDGCSNSYKRYKARLFQQEYGDEVVSSASETDED